MRSLHEHVAIVVERLPRMDYANGRDVLNTMIGWVKDSYFDGAITQWEAVAFRAALVAAWRDNSQWQARVAALRDELL